ncbi:MAG: acyl-CoA dehydrogenase family protein [Mesorhizobium sp.]|nr:acyl-CoA dehydrogenase family protein [Mesorhizobium sp.]
MADVQNTEPADAAMFRADVRTWLATNLPAEFLADSPAYSDPSIDEVRAWERHLYEAGFVALAVPRAYGGQGRTMREHLIVNQEIGLLAAPESVNSIGKEIISSILLALGSESQKRRYLPRIFSMEEIWCQGFSEPQAGSDLAAVRTRAIADGDGWLISGSKIWTSYAQRADFCLLLVRTGDVAARYDSLTLMIVPMTTPGIDSRPIRQIDGSDEFCEVFFRDVRVGQDAVVGEVNRGWSGAVSVLEVERATNRMYRGWRFENEVRHILNACGGAARGDVLTGLSKAATDARITQLYAEEIVRTIMAGRSPGATGSLMKLHWSEAHQQFADFALRMLSRPVGHVTPELARARQRFELIYLRARSETLIAGTSEVQASIIADRVMRLPKGGSK